MTLPRIAWSAAEFAQMLGLSVDAVYDCLNSGAIPATKFGQQWRISDVYVQQVRNGDIPLPVRSAS